MVNLTSIVTKVGDNGTTNTSTLKNVSKTSPVIRALSSVDELNAHLGVCTTFACTTFAYFTYKHLEKIQSELFELGAEISNPSQLHITDEDILYLERLIGEVNSKLSPLKSFVLPGGSKLASQLHLARTICRRAEIDVWSITGKDLTSHKPAVYLNRLSDYLFVLARQVNAYYDYKDTLWEPKKKEEKNE